MRVKHIGLILLAVLCSLLGVCGASANSSYPYEIQGYDVQMQVTKKNVYHVQETIVVYFNQSRHGIYRDIPVVNNVSREDGSTSRIQAQIENIKCSGTYSVSRASNYCRIKLGDPEQTILGMKTYNISYDYHMGNDVLEDADEFYFNVIGTSWDTTISNVTFTIQMPEAIDESKLGMACGQQGSTNTAGLRYALDGNVLQGELDSSITLQPHEAVTVRMVMPDGYFEKTRGKDWPALLAILLSVAAMAAAFVMWWKVGRDDVVVETIQFYPPRGLNSLEVAFAFNGEANSEDVVSLVVYLAQKGYITIQEDAKGLLGKTNFTLQKTRMYDGNNNVERIFMEGLFAKGDTVQKSDLKNSFYKTINKVLKLMNSKKNKEVLFFKNSINKHIICIALVIVVLEMSLYKPMYSYSYSVISALMTPLAMALYFYTILFALFKRKGIIEKIVPVMMLFMAFGIFGYFIYDSMLFTPWIYKIALVVGLISCAVILFFDHYMPKRTEYGTEILGRLRGFQTFLKTAEKDRLEAMVERNPEYFYEVLPYAYVLDVSDVWMKKFEAIAAEPPHWYHSHYGMSGFNMMRFNNFMDSTMRSASSAMTSSPSSSGGGHAGGGSGGGGGGSW